MASTTKHLCSPDYFPRYFSYGVPTGDIADALVNRVIAAGIADEATKVDQEPTLGSDKANFPLQAADLYVGLIRASALGDNDARALLRTITIKDRGFLWDMEHLAQLLGRSLKRAPELTSGKFYEGRKARSKRLGADRKLLTGRERPPNE